jgi:uncharacterized membrane protein YhaH (DUF805 family)
MQYFIKCIKQYADFNGRARRKEYWMFTLFFMIIYYAVIGIGAFMQSGLLLGLGGLFALGLLLPSIGVAVRRMHDVDKSGWFILIPIYNLILACTEGTPGPNQYGEDPKGSGPTLDIEQGIEHKN